jgi:uncharacterized membrane protein
MSIFILLHILSVLVWVGGMFFAYMVLRPSAAEVLQPPERLRLWNKVFARFFNWVWLAVFVLLTSGFYMVYQLGGFALMPHYVHAMMLLGIIMILIFTYVFFKCYVQFNLLVDAKEWPKAGEVLVTIRKLVALNLSIGFLNIAIVIMGRG